MRNTPSSRTQKVPPPKPIEGDHVTLFTFAEASPYLKVHAQTIRRMIREGEIPASYVTRIGGHRRGSKRGKVFMSGHQIVGLLRHWADAGVPTEPRTPPPIRRQRARESATKPTASKSVTK